MNLIEAGKVKFACFLCNEANYPLKIVLSLKNGCDLRENNQNSVAASNRI